MRVSKIISLFALFVCSVSAQDTVHVKNGWNVIGSVKSGAIPDVLFTVPDSLITSSYWGYSPGVGYELTDTLETGLGYWVKAKSDGLIVYKNIPPVDSCILKAFIYEGKFYHTVRIGDQCWMAEYLDAGVMIDSLLGSTDNEKTEKYCYNNDPANCALYGGLYQWDEAMHYDTTRGAQGICPTGWHIPTIAEFLHLTYIVNFDGNALKAIGQGVGGGAGTNTTGFSSLLAGYRTSIPYFQNLGTATYFWSSTRLWSTFVPYYYYAGLDDNFSNIDALYTDKFEGFSVRCVED